MDQDLANVIVEAVTKRVDERLGEAFHKFDERLEKHTAIVLEAHEEHRRAIVQLQREVFGSDAPPPGDDVAAAKELQLSARTKALTKRVTEGEGSVAELTGVVLATKGEVKELKDQVADVIEILGSIKGLLSGVLTHPVTRKLAVAAAVAAAAWLGTVQSRLDARAEKIERDMARIDGGAR